MTRAIASLKKQVAALTAQIKPPNSLAARLDTLTDQQRTQYDRYSERMSAFIARNDIDEDGNPGNAYAMTLRGYGPQLPARINKALFGEMPTLPLNASDEQAAQMWLNEVTR
ncbi:hypothetical protein [Bradyrhizobium uaiense]|uniref:Uncharacterized protein n=1 Tax=Bradyrhizobium uaiense TaxID=2594946 RepID=A0A6P1BTG8_9BRAD|nr:hypothetical protein [Bradyrhizobium uaiense]NEV00991.1 hypothetical protein [Bradyrhizobium uaiense]